MNHKYTLPQINKMKSGDKAQYIIELQNEMYNKEKEFNIELAKKTRELEEKPKYFAEYIFGLAIATFMVLAVLGYQLDGFSGAVQVELIGIALVIIVKIGNLVWDK